MRLSTHGTLAMFFGDRQMDVTKLISSRNPEYIPAPRGEFVDTETGLTMIEQDGLIIAVLDNIKQFFRARSAILRLHAHSQCIGALTLPRGARIGPEVISYLALDGIVLAEEVGDGTPLENARAFAQDFEKSRTAGLLNLQHYNDEVQQHAGQTQQTTDPDNNHFDW